MRTLLLMAAGLGSRYGSFKQVDRVGPDGEMLLEYAIFDARRSGFGRIVFIIRDELTTAIAEVTRRLPSDLHISCVCQDSRRMPSWFALPPRTKPWGTVHAVLAAGRAVDTPFAVANADDFYGPDAYRLAMAACADAERDRTYAVIGLPLEKTLSEHGSVVRGICRIDDGLLRQLTEVYDIRRTPDGIRGAAGDRVVQLTGRELASMNLWVFEPGIFQALEDRFDAFLHRRGNDPKAELPLPVGINELLHGRKVHVRAIEAPGPWFGLTHPNDRPRVVAGLRELHDRGTYPTPLWRQA